MDSPSELEAEIDSCLVYEVFRRPEHWIGDPSPASLSSFLSGAETRAIYGMSGLPRWRVYGTLCVSGLQDSLVAATGNPSLNIGWSSAIQLTHFSLAEGFAKLRDTLLDWHRRKRLDLDDTSFHRTPRPLDTGEFWNHFSKRTGMYTGDNSGWSLFCFLNGMQCGGDWLNLPPMPRGKEIFERITSWSERHYGAPFAAFRICDSRDLLAQGGLRAADGRSPSQQS